MDHDHLQIPIDSDDASWKQRCSEMMEELKNMQFPSQDAASQPELLHKELVVEKEVMISELYKAVKNGNVDNFVDVLKGQCIERKLPLSDIFDKVTGAGDSLLHVAADKGREQIAELICDHFPKLLIRRNVRGDTPLHVAVRSKNSPIVNLILSQVKSTHDVMKDKEITREKNEHGNTPLHEAVNSGDLGVVEVILDADKPVVHYLNKSKRSPLFLAVESGNEKILNLLLQIPFPADQSLPQCFGNSPLHAAISKQKPDLLKEILEKRPELIYLRDEYGGTPLHYAADMNYVEGFHILLQKSLEESDQIPLERNKKGDLPIHLACKKGHVEVVKEFFQHEWCINPYDLLNQKGQNILHIAAENGRRNVVQYLLGNQMINQFVINQKDNDGNTPLHLASINLFPKVLHLITHDERINMNLMNNDGLTALDIVGLTLKIQMTVRKFLAILVLEEADGFVKVNDMLHSQHQQQSKMDRLNDLLNTFLVVATLMVTVTFAAAFTMPGGVYSSDDSNPKNRGMAVLAHKPLFWVFTIFNTIAMYSSVIACGLMLTARVVDNKLAIRATFIAITCLGVAFLAVPVAFLTAALLVVDNNYPLVIVITVIGLMCYYPILMSLYLAFVPIGIRFDLFGVSAGVALARLITLIDYDDKPEGSSSQKADKDKNKDKDKDD